MQKAGFSMNPSMLPWTISYMQSPLSALMCLCVCYHEFLMTIFHNIIIIHLFAINKQTEFNTE